MSKHEFMLEASARANVGKGASRRLRRLENGIPAIVYGGTKAPTNITLMHNHLMHMVENEAFFASIVTLSIDGVEEEVVIKAMQRHPAKPRIMHADFQRVSADKPLHVKIPLHFINQDISVGVKEGGGLVSHLMNELEISCLPRYLPKYIEVDLINLEVGHSLHIADLKLPEGVSSVALSHGESGNHAVISITAPSKVEAEPAAPAAATSKKPAAAKKPDAAAPTKK